MDLQITPKKLSGAVTPPPSKSQAHRLLIAAALAEGTSTLHNIARSQDIEATLRCVTALGGSWTETSPGTLTVTGIGGRRLSGGAPADMAAARAWAVESGISDGTAPGGAVTRQQLADLVHVSSRTIISLEKGQYNPSLLLAYRLALVFRTTVEDLYCLAENKEQEDRENEEWT